MPQPDPIFFSELAEKAPQLRALARQLVKSDEADDLAQDAMVVALSRPERPRVLGAWLRQVVRNEHRARVRSTLRRRSREQRSFIEEPPPGVIDELAQAEIFAAVREVVHELEEPYRSVLSSRFFEDRSAADIARAEGCPAATVRWRVQEGLRLTRRKLDERFAGRGRWLAALVVFVGAPVISPSTAIASGEQPMTKLAILKALTTTAAVAATVTLVYHGTAPDAAAESERGGSEPSATALAGDDRVSVSPAVAQRTFDRFGSASNSASDDPRSTDETALECNPGPGDLGCPGPAAEALSTGFGPVIGKCLGLDDAASIEDALPPGAVIDLLLQVKHDPERGHIVDTVTVERIEGIDAQGLEACVTEAMRSAVVQGVTDDTLSVKLSLRGDGEGARALHMVEAKPGPTEVDARDPMNAIEELALPRRGAERAQVSIVECAEFDCPFCTKARDTIDRIIADYGDRVAVYWMHHPLPSHPGAEIAARASVAAGNQGKFWDMHDLLFDEPTARTAEDMRRHASTLGLDVDRFMIDLDAEQTQQTIDTQKATCMGNGVRGTPSFFINGDLIIGARPYEEFRTLIEDELGDAAE